MSFSRIMALFAVMLFGIPTAWADGNVFFNSQLNFGSATFAGNSGFFFGGADGGPAVFSGGADTKTGSSQIQGLIGLQSSTFVPQGKKGSGEAGGSLSFSYDAFHQGGIFQNSNSTSVNTWSSSTGNGSASSNVFHQGGTQQWSNKAGGGKG